MSSEAKSTECEDEDLSCGLLLRDIEEISKALYLHQSPNKPFNSSNEHRPNVAAKSSISESKSSVTIQNPSNNGKKSSLWKWKPLKALAHIRNHRFNCYFFLHVHAIEGLPPKFNNLNLCITWKRKNDVLRTRPARVCSGMAEFEETLMHRCTIYGGRTGPHGSAKYEPKIFLLRVSVMGPTELDIGNYWIDLSRLLPLTMEELERDKGSSGKWTTSFELTSEAKGAILNVSFGFSILDSNSFDPGCFVKVPDIVREGGMNNRFVDFENFGRAPRISTEGSYFHSQSAKNVNFLEEIFSKQESELSQSVTLLYSKLDEKKTGNLMDFDHSLESEFSETGFDVIEQGIEVSTKNQIKIEKCGSQRFDSNLIETIDVAEIFEEETAFDDYVKSNSKLTEEHAYDNESAFEEYSISFYDMLTSKQTEDSSLNINNYYEQESCIKPKSTKSLISLNDVSESIENDFLNMLSVGQSQDENTDDYDLSFPIQAVEKNHNTVNQSSLRSRRNAKMLENLETEALMHEWGITEKAFQYSPHTNSGGFGSPVYIPSEEPLKLPSIEEGVGPIVRTKDGGFLRSMNPLLFANVNNGARLIVQVSAPVVLPPAMGFTVMEILQCWASGGFEKMCIQVNELMPLEDVTGKTMREVLSEGEPGSNAFYRGALQRESDIGVESFVEENPTGHPPFPQSSENVSCSNSEPLESDYLSFEELVPMAITNIEGLLLQGLRIQSGMPDQETPSSIKIKATELSCNFSSDSAFVNVDELMKYFLSLGEWIRLDSSEFRVQDEASENKICGVFGKIFKMGFKVQLRDPLRNYEMVGPSMLALIQVDRIYSSDKTCDWLLEGNDFEQNETKIHKPLFKVSEGHLAGLNVTHGNKQLWGTSRQQQSGSRWLFSSGMAKSNKNLISSSNAVVKYSNGLLRKAWTEDVLWSISLLNPGEAATWDEQVALNVHVRNPDIIFPTKSVE